MKFLGKKRGFTFVEMLGVLCIVVLLIGISTVSFRHGQAKARDVVRKNDLQAIADALISYSNDHGRFPSSIYDNGQQAIRISQALNMVAEGGLYKASGLEMLFYPDDEIVKNILGWTTIDPEYFETATLAPSDVGTMGGSQGQEIHRLKDSVNDDKFETISAIIETAEKDVPVATKLTSSKRIMNYSIVTQGMCASSLKKYLVDEGYISTIPSDPSGESVNLQTNICSDSGNFQGGVNANDTGWSIKDTQCFANTNTGCTQICKEGYVYVSDGEHFALIAHMESENGGNYETTACGSCEIAGQCKRTDDKPTTWESTSQLPCDITDEFSRNFSCIQDEGVVEYSTGEYYFYIY